MAVVKNLMVRAGADFSGLYKEMQKTQQVMNNFKSSINSSMKKVASILATVGVGYGIKEATKAAIEFEASFQQIGRIMGESAGEFTKWASSQSSALAMSKGELIKYSAVYGNLISGFSSSTAETMKYTEDLLKASSVIASATGRSMEDIMDRIRSGLLGNTEAIEDLGVNVNVAMIQSTEAFKKFANGKSWQQLDFQTQQQIRLMAILEQTNKKYGTELMNNTATAQARFIAELKNLQLALGQAFLPIYQVILPALTAFVQKITQVVSIIAQFSQALFGKPAEQKQQVATTQLQSKALGGVAKGYDKVGKAAKKANGQLAGFDELNTLGQGNSDTGSGAGEVGGVGPEMPAMDMNVALLSDSMVEVSETVKKTVDNIKAKIQEFKTFFEENKAAILSTVSGIAAGLSSFWIISNWGTITAAFQAASAAITSAIASISAPVLAVASVIALLVGNIVYLWQTNEKFRNSVISIWAQIKGTVTSVAASMWNLIKGLWETYGEGIVNNVKGIMTGIQNIILTVWNGYIYPIISNGLKMFKEIWDSSLSGVFKNVLSFVANLINSALEILNKFILPLINYLLLILAPAFQTVFSGILYVVRFTITSLAPIINGIITVLNGVITFITGVFTGNWRKAWEGIKLIFKGVFDTLYGIIKVPLNLIIDAINFVIKGLNELLSFKVPSIVPGIGGKQIGVTIPTIPKLASGGIIDSPTVAMIGEAGAEAVVPLENNTDWINELTKKILEAMDSNKNNSNIEVILELNGSTLGRAVIENINKLQRQEGRILLNI